MNRKQGNECRYQVLIDLDPNGKPSSKVENYADRDAAQARIRVLRKKGCRVTFWDTRKNSLSPLFRF